MDNTDLEIGLTIWKDGMGVCLLTRRMALDENGAVQDNQYVFNTSPGFDWEDDEELLRLLDDTLTGMRAEVRHRMRTIRQGAAS